MTPAGVGDTDESHQKLFKASDVPASSLKKEFSAKHDRRIVTPSVGLNYQIPKVKIEPFGGNATEFPAWEIAFDALKGHKDISVVLKLNLLSQHLKGEARSLVIGLLPYQQVTRI